MTQAQIEAQQVIAAWFDKPSLYISGPSERSMRKAQDLIEQLYVNDLEIVERKSE